MHRVDVAVVGGGPAGTSAGRAAAEHGADALVIEKGVPRADREGLGPDSTDAAGMLDYWVDIMDVDVDDIPDGVILRELDGADFVGPNETVTVRTTGIEATYPKFGFTFHRARFDDWLRSEAEAAGAEYRVGTGVADVDPSLDGPHALTLRDGEEVLADYLVLADGPQRTITTPVLDSFLPERVVDRIDATRANHIAYQEYREFPEELFEPELLKFWWGVMPGHTAYPWVFPNDGRVARVGLTMPINLDLESVENRDAYRLLRPEDERVPQGGTYVERLLEWAYPDYDLEDFPVVEGRGKRKGTETYPISSTRPIDSPTEAGIAVVGGAMGATSAFHEGGDHVAVRTGKIAGRLAGLGALRAYNREWKEAIGEEVLRNVALADMVRGFGPDDWDRAFAAARDMTGGGTRSPSPTGALRSGTTALRMLARYEWTKFGYRNGYVQITEDEYTV
jgi:electron-transferring-flavoprotein dehydrogenase